MGIKSALKTEKPSGRNISIASQTIRVNQSNQRTTEAAQSVNYKRAKKIDLHQNLKLPVRNKFQP